MTNKIQEISYIYNKTVLKQQLLIGIIYKLQMLRQKWTKQEDDALIVSVQQVGSTNDWSQISQYMYQHVGSTRTGKQCRQRWNNHLQPTVIKKSWTKEEQLQLFHLYQLLGNRWKNISTYFQSRTDNDIKNHFYSTLRRSLRRLNKMLGQKNSTSQLREIKPSVLTQIIDFISQEQNISENNNNRIFSNFCSLKVTELLKLIFQFSQFKPRKSNLSQGINKTTKDKIQIIIDLVKQFKKFKNEFYKFQNEEIQNKNKNIKQVEIIDQGNSNLSSYELSIDGQKIKKRSHNYVNTIVIINNVRNDQLFHDKQQHNLDKCQQYDKNQSLFNDNHNNTIIFKKGVFWEEVQDNRTESQKNIL